MKRSVLGVIIALISLTAIVGIVVANKSEDKSSSTASSSETMGNMNQTGGTNEPQMTMAQNSVEISDFSFKPGKIIVKKGTTVTWTNRDSARHDITPDSESADFKASELLSKGESYSVTFNTVGTYNYFCSPHPYMKGTVEVTE